MRNLVFLTIGLFIFSCRKPVDPIVSSLETDLQPHLPSVVYDYEGNLNFSTHIQNDPLLNLFLGFLPEDNPVTNDGATLGRVLFYDKKLSVNDQISCASCHLQAHAFSDPRVKSIGAYGEETSRNSMGFQNLIFSNRMFWDLRVVGLENQIHVPIENPIEMAQPMDSLVQKLQSVAYYAPLFDQAFGTTEINAERISFALAQFIRSITSFQSKYDVGMENDFSNFSPIELQGKDLFFGGDLRCNHCHSTQNFYNNQAMNNGLDSVYEDQGQFLATGNINDQGEFKVPSLRNVALTAPYMHDGRFATLEEVIEHYSTGVQPHVNLNDRLTVELTTGGTPFNSNMTAEEKNAIVAFLHTLTDEAMINNESFSDPFE